MKKRGTDITNDSWTLLTIKSGSKSGKVIYSRFISFAMLVWELFTKNMQIAIMHIKLKHSTVKALNEYDHSVRWRGWWALSWTASYLMVLIYQFFSNATTISYPDAKGTIWFARVYSKPLLFTLWAIMVKVTVLLILKKVYATLVKFRQTTLVMFGEV